MQVKDSELNLARSIQKEFTTFIQTFQDKGVFKYKRQAEIAINNGRRTLLISLSDFLNYNHELAGTVFDEYYKYEPYLNQALTEFMHEYENFLSNTEQVRANDQQMERYEVAFDQGYISNVNDSVRELRS